MGQGQPLVYILGHAFKIAPLNLAPFNRDFKLEDNPVVARELVLLLPGQRASMTVLFVDKFTRLAFILDFPSKGKNCYGRLQVLAR